MAEQVLKNINVSIAGRTYPLKIDEGEEHDIMAVVKEINEQVNNFQLTFAKNDRQDSIAMVLLTYAVELHKNRKNNALNAADPAFSERLHQLNEIIDRLLA